MRSRKVVAVVALAVLVIALGFAGYFYFTRSSRTAIDSIAVLPFANASGDPNTEYLSDGITESIISSLSQLPQLRVMARSTVFSYKGKDVDPRKVGHDLGVRAVLMGRLIQQGDNLTIRTELVNVSDGTQLWGEQYNRKIADLVTVQQEIARDISERLRLRLTGEQRQQLAKSYTTQSEAYQEYLKGRYASYNQGLEEEDTKALAHFNRAASLDPNFAPAYAGVAAMYADLSSLSMPPSEAMPKAKDAVLKALALDPSLAEAHLSLATIYWWGDWNYAAADQEFKRAIELNPNEPDTYEVYSNFLARMGRFDEAAAMANHSMELDPVTPDRGTALLRVYYYSRQYDKVIEQAPKIIEASPDSKQAPLFLGGAYLQKGMREQAIAELRKAADVDPTTFGLGMLGYAYGVAGRREETLKVIAELQDQSKRHFVSRFEVARVYVGLGDKERAFEWLQKAYDVHDDRLTRLKHDPNFDNLRSDPRFADLLRRVGLPQ